MDFRKFKNWFGFKWTVKIKRIINYRKIWFLFNGYSAAGDQKWARGQLKYDGFPVSLVRKMMWSPKKTKKVFIEILTVFPVEIRCSPKKKKKKGLQASHADFSVSFRWAPSRAHGPAEPDGLPEAHGPPKVHGPRGHSPPCPPLGGPE